MGTQKTEAPVSAEALAKTLSTNQNHNSQDPPRKPVLLTGEAAALSYHRALPGWLQKPTGTCSIVLRCLSFDCALNCALKLYPIASKNVRWYPMRDLDVAP